MTSPTGDKRKLNYPLNLSLVPSIVTPDEPINDLVLDWPTTDSDEAVAVTLTLSLNEYVALASCVDVGSDIAYGDQAILLWWIWVRSINSMAFCEQVNDCVDNNVSTQISINNMVLEQGLINPDQIDPIPPQMDIRMPPATRQEDSAPPPAGCDKDALWTGILEIVTRLDAMGLDFLEEIVAHTDKAERIANIIDLVPLFGDTIADVITALADNAQDLENAYVAHSSQTVIEDTACALFELVCEECRYPTFEEVYDEYASAGISGIQDIASYGVTAAIDYLVGTSGLANAVVWYTMQTTILYTLYLGGTFLNVRGTKWLAIWADIGEDAPNNGWELLCDGCQDEWCQEWAFAVSHTEWETRLHFGNWVAGGHDTFIDPGENPPPYNKQNQIYVPAFGSTLTEISVTITGDLSIGWTLALFEYTAIGDIVGASFSSIGLSNPGTYVWNGSQELANEMLIALGTGDQFPAPNPLITNVRLRGTGVNPYTGGNAC